MSEDLSPTLVMRRFFKALQEENLFAAELWATNEHFNGGEVDYTEKFDRLVQENSLSMDVIEWLLAHASVHRNIGFFARSRDSRSHRYRSKPTWRGTICKWVQQWCQVLEGMSEQQQRITKLVYELGWLHASYEWLDSEAGHVWLFTTTKPATILAMALNEERTYNYNSGKHETRKVNRKVIDKLIAKNLVDLSKSGDHLVTRYQDDEYRALVLKLIKHRDVSKPMPKEFTDFIRDTVAKYKIYVRLTEDLPQLLDGKTAE